MRVFKKCLILFFLGGSHWNGHKHFGANGRRYLLRSKFHARDANVPSSVENH